MGVKLWDSIKRIILKKGDRMRIREIIRVDDFKSMKGTWNDVLALENYRLYCYRIKQMGESKKIKFKTVTHVT